MKKTLSLLALLMMAVAVPQSARAYDFSAVSPSGHTLYYNLTTAGGETYAVVASPVVRMDSASLSWRGFVKPTGQLVIPDSVDWNGTRYAVKELSRAAFCKCDSLTSVTVPQGG